MSFATTKHLNLRAVRESDKDSFLALGNDLRVVLTTNPGYVVPRTWTMDKQIVSAALLAVVYEVKKEYAGLRRWDEGEERKDEEDKTQEDWDRELFAGRCWLHVRQTKNRDASFGISVIPQWWGHGFATEVTEWVTQHAFEQLGLHRISLGFFADNLRAQRVYEKCGFVREGLMRKAFWRDGHWIDEVVMGIVDEDYWQRKKVPASKS
ncbi:acyl-CoA N-acyltransferase [Calocera viscosa TUFC12733]|uniref:Acyl-CoA N-acyltransferase n=1 Tax=Calocera viscosa (strain TUFC12733) TaxID=1330018 RepID=A0A167KGV1_CALVF|nr:acyl-CoA N-acyltransferase [Calocera viscosa TUFC12733]